MQLLTTTPRSVAPAASGARSAAAPAPAACLRASSSQRSAPGTQRQQLGAAQQRVQQRNGVVAARRPAAARRLHVAASTANYGGEWATPRDSYVTVGLAHCFAKGEDGKLQDQYVIEPITANALECMKAGGKTSFLHVFSMRLGEALEKNKASFPEEFAIGSFCEEYETRCDSCARTWMRPHALDNLLDIVPLGQMKGGFNYSVSDKRVLNADNIVNDDDNIKQDISIDVYGRKTKEEAAAAISAKDAPAAAPAAPAAAEEDDMDALLSV
ncbi:hypothetical protein C2E20_4052 [Micractinium conductrix]|uniref:Uncharacterized protein n=1 Tax=Micractinium conductrix TaxID=554055 RepID=A0A2P6VEX7_9CHLO|nr:hypothetical protein C2E20_4052 [Micractinium conductrix]|eukprot:PSC72627.1 hypothetical protein C2E20_4052 [Micractinium conductrix]